MALCIIVKERSTFNEQHSIKLKIPSLKETQIKAQARQFDLQIIHQ